MFVSAAITRKGVPRWILRCLQAGLFELIVCPQLLSELNDVLLRGKFRRYLSEDEAKAYVVLVAEKATFAQPEEVVPVSQDPDDDYLVALTLGSRAHFLVSGDPHLLDLKQAGSSPIVSPRLFLELLDYGLLLEEYRRPVR